MSALGPGRVKTPKAPKRRESSFSHRSISSALKIFQDLDCDPKEYHSMASLSFRVFTRPGPLAVIERRVEPRELPAGVGPPHARPVIYPRGPRRTSDLWHRTTAEP